METKTKKKYVAPKMAVIETSPTSILAGSLQNAIGISEGDYTLPDGETELWGD